VLRTITAWTEDDVGDWVAHLSCLHRQHVRHAPPFRDRPWVLDAEGRAEHLGTDLDCPLCDRAELPDDLEVVRTARFDDRSLPAGLRRDHHVAAGVWGRLRVLRGSARFTMATAPPVDRVVVAGESQPIPPGVPHAVQPDPSTELEVDFLRRPPPNGAPTAQDPEPPT
jgi:tellurite methyltransferase